jgi:1-acyl-sn-glycerol-3-phosphate acyltransferase
MSPPRPDGYVAPPPPRLTDCVRTARAAITHVVPAVLRLASGRTRELPSTTTREGLEDIRGTFGAALRSLGIELSVLHAERVPEEGGLVFFWNQESHLDHLVLATAMPRPFFSLFNNAVARVPFYGAHMRRTSHVHVDRNDESQWRPAVRRAAERVKAGECVLVSPEGTRSWDGELLPMKRGALELAALSERPIVCATVIGGHARMPRGSAVVRRGPLRVVFSSPISTEGDPATLADAVTETFTTLKREHAIGA